MIAYHGKATNKTKILKQLRAHAKADEIVKGVYWQNGKGCAVGCAIHSSNHAEYEPQFGIPIMLATLEDRIFEGLPNAEAKAWPINFMGVIRPGADLSLVGWKFLYWLLTDEKVNPGINHSEVKGAVKRCAEVLLPLTRGEPRAAASAARAAVTAAVTAARAAAAGAANSAAYSAASAARAAAGAAYSAAYSAANSAANSAARSAARSAAYSAANSAAYCAAAYCAAAGAAYSARSAAASAASAYSAANSAAYSRMAKKLLALLKAAPQIEDKF